jgi:CheY-like chemotaxis protein
MVPSLAAMHGFRTAEIPVKHHRRQHGRSKYGLKRFVRGFLDMWTVFFLQNFRQRPMHLMGMVSLLMLGGGCCLAFFLARVVLPLSVFMLLSSALPALLIGAVLTTMIGLLAEWNVHKNAENVASEPIAETIGINGASRVGHFSTDLFGEGYEAPSGATALLLADKQAILELNGAHLRRAGWRVLTAGSCEEARSKLSAEVDVVLLDLYLQDGSSRTVAEFVRDARENSPPPEIIFLPSAAEVGGVPAAPRKGSFEYRLSHPTAQLLGTALQALQVRRRALTTSGA